MASLPPRSSAAGRSRLSSSQSAEASSSSDTAQQDQHPSADHDSLASDAREIPETMFPVTPTSPPRSTEELLAAESSNDADTLADTSTSVPGITVAPSSSSLQPLPEPRKCWICYADETEDTPRNKEWRSPCPCALTAHEACLLDWLADMENPKSPRRAAGKTKMLCPQCKSEIVIARPRSAVVDFMKLVERVVGRMVLPGVAFTVAGMVYAGCCAHGLSSMFLVFGREEVRQILESGAQQQQQSRGWNPRLNVGLPLIPLVLIFSRTRYAEGLLPAIPVLFFATHRPGGHELELDMWPPSASVTFAALPYAKSFYSMLYERLFGRLERKWLAEVQPRSGEDGQPGGQDTEDEDHDHHHHHHDDDGEVLMEIELQVGVGAFQNPLRGGGDADAGNQQGAQDDAGQQQAAGQENHILGRRQDNIIHDSGNLADTVLGALLFPAISAGMGGILKLALPRTWTAPPSSLDRAKAGLLQTKWGRSVVGGCLFVILKDALGLYCRWKLAQSHRKRRVLNYDRAKKRVVNP